MRVSVITPVLNSKAYIRGCVENVVGQGVGSLEHIVVDGGSSDGTIDLLRELSSEYPHLRIIPGPDKGQSDAMNKGVRAAQGQVIGFLNADDFYEDQTISRALSHLESISRPTLIAGNCRILDENDQTLSWNKPTTITFKDFLLGWNVKQFPANPSAYFYHAELHNLVGLYDENDHFAMDFDFLVRCAEQADMVYVDEHWGNFRLRPGCKTFGDLGNTKRRLTEVIKRYEAHLSPVERVEMKVRRFVNKDFKAGLNKRLKLVGR